jgi:hypothetical protein
MPTKRVRILCTANSRRANGERPLRHDSDDRFEVESGGTKASFVRSEAIWEMGELAHTIA